MYFLVSWPTKCQSRQVWWLLFLQNDVWEYVLGICTSLIGAWFLPCSFLPELCLGGCDQWAPPWRFLYPLAFTGLHQWKSFADDLFKISTLLLAFVILSCKGSLYTWLGQRNVGWSYLDSPLAGASRWQGCLDTMMLLSVACAQRLSLHLRS